MSVEITHHIEEIINERYHDGAGNVYTLLWDDNTLVDAEGGTCVILLNSDDEMVVVEESHFEDYFYSESERNAVQTRLDFQDMDDELN